MKVLSRLSSLLLCGIAMSAAAQNKFVHIYQSDLNTQTTQELVGYDKNGKPVYTTKTVNLGKFVSYPYQMVDSVSFLAPANGTPTLRLHHHMTGNSSVRTFKGENITKWSIGPDVPKFRITTDPALDEVESRTEYLPGTLTIDGNGVFEDFTGDIQIRGRGNSTWQYAKKAYRIKLPEKTKLCGYRKAKNYVLLANHIDLSFMRNEAACLVTQYSGAPYPTHATPVDVYFNGTYKGSYMLIEKVGINNGSVNIPKEQEAETCMFQLDVSYDEELRAKTPIFKLPLMHKDPDAPEDKAEAQAWYDEWCQDFYKMEQAVASGKNLGDYIDYTSLAQYLLVYNLTCNQEICHPKSIYMYKTRGGKYNFGPAWDFDWAFGYYPTYKYESDDQMSQDEEKKLYNEVVDYATKEFGYENWGFFTYKGVEYMWGGYGWIYIKQANGQWGVWNVGNTVNYLPSYANYLLGVGDNTGRYTGDKEIGNGGEFFLSMIIDNPEFMTAYESVWEEFESHLDEFWADFDAYAQTLEPSAARNHTVWENSYNTAVDSEFNSVIDGRYTGAIRQLRLWIEKRLEIMGDASKNYGLYDPKTTYKRGSITK